MKRLLFALMLFPAITLSQGYGVDVSQSKDMTPGGELISASNMFYVGTITTIVGAGISVYGTSEADQTIAFVGVGLSVAGAVVYLMSFSKIGSAGRLMDSRGVGLASNGIGLSYRF